MMSLPVPLTVDLTDTRRCFGTDPLDPQKASFNLLTDIQNKIKASPLTWTFNWVEGHQDEQHGVVDFWRQLNKVCNSLAKVYWNQTRRMSPRGNHRFGNEGWSVLIQGKKLAKMTMWDLYNHFFGKKSQDYWMPKHSITPHLFAKINWIACGKAINELPFGKRRWLVKHLMGFCAVGRMMKRWRE
jgi:hypothetical protein